MKHIQSPEGTLGRHLKAPLGPKQSGKIKPVALAVIKLRLSEGISQSVENSILFF